MGHDKAGGAKRRYWELLLALSIAASLTSLWGPAVAGDVISSAPAPASNPTLAGSEASNARADFRGEAASTNAREIADWVVRTGDSQGMPFIIVDKRDTRVFVFDAQARLTGASAALLGLAIGDNSSPGIGTRALPDIAPAERTTPAGRFMASLGRNIDNQETLWIDYDTALALHQVRGTGTRQHRLERLGVRSPLSRRITFGCINVPAKFYAEVVQPQFTGTSGVVYILPDTKSIGEVFFSRAANS